MEENMICVLVLLVLSLPFYSYEDRMDFDIKDITAYSVQKGPKLEGSFIES